MSEENIPQMRETIERLSKDKSGLEKQVSDLNSQLRVNEAQDVFRSEGFNPANGKLFAAVFPEGDITAEAVVAFADEQGLPLLEGAQGSSEGSGESTSEATDGSEGLAGMAGGGSGAGDGGAGGAAVETLTRAEWQALATSDPAAARAAIASGRVEISKDNPYVKDSVSAPGVNPYAALAVTDA